MNIGRGVRVVVAAVGGDGARESEMVALLLRDAGFDVVWLGGGCAPAAIADAAVQEDADAAVLSCDGAGGDAIMEVTRRMTANGAGAVAIVCRGELGREEAERLGGLGAVKLFAAETGGEEIIAYLAARAK